MVDVTWILNEPCLYWKLLLSFNNNKQNNVKYLDFTYMYDKIFSNQSHSLFAGLLFKK